MLNILLDNWDSVLIILAVVAVAVALYYNGKRGIVDEMIYKIVTELEREYGSGPGNLKLAAAVERLYPQLPAIVRVLTTSAGIVRMIEDGLAAAKDRWEKNKAIEDYIRQ